MAPCIRPLYLGTSLFIAWIAAPSLAGAEIIDYEITGVGTGSLNGDAFSKQPFEITMIGDTAKLSGDIIDPLISADFSLGSLGDAVFLIPTRLGLNPINNGIFFSRSS